MFELVVYRVYKRINSGYRLKLDSPQDGAFEGFREGLVNFLGAGKLTLEGVEEGLHGVTCDFTDEARLVIKVHAIQVVFVANKDLARLRDVPHLRRCELVETL